MKKAKFNVSLISCVLWVASMVAESQAQSWNLTGNAGTSTSSNFLGTTDAVNLKIRTNNTVRMTITSAGKIGIGTSAPSNKLTVAGTADFTGNVGIGTPNPLAKLDVNGNVALNSFELRLKAGNDINHGLKHDLSVDGPYLYGFQGGALGTIGLPHSLTWDYGGNITVQNTINTRTFVIDNSQHNNANIDSNALIFGSVGSGEGIGSKRTANGNQYGLDLYTGHANRLAITNGGNVGIGTNLPNALLHLNKITDPTLLFSNSTTGSLFTDGTALYQSGNDFKIENGENGNIIFNNNLAERMRITGTGNIGIGIIAPLAKLHVYKGSSTQSPDANANLVVESNVNSYVNFLTPLNNENGLLFGLAGNSASGALIYNTTAIKKGFQFRTGGNVTRMVLDSVGKVGIGTNTPGEKLTVIGPDNVSATNISTFYSNNLSQGIGIGMDQIRKIGTNTNSAFYINAKGTGNLILQNSATGNVGIGSSSPTSKLYITQNANARALYVENNTTSYNQPTAWFQNLGTGPVARFTGNGPSLLEAPVWAESIGNAPAIYCSGGIALFASGNVGIGYAYPTYPLEVCGTIRATEVRVETPWCDYVFKKDYQLKSLEQVESYVNKYGHLEGIATAAEVEKEGLKVGETAKAMMEKIEELTLYLIQLSKENKEMQKEIEKLKK